MVDNLTPNERSRRMALVKSEDTKPELVVRRLVTELRLGYRLHQQWLPGRPDLVFQGRKKVIFIHGCFWHLHDGCPNARMPESRQDYWRSKLENNKLRDTINIKTLQDMGWKVLVIWECETKDLETLRNRIVTFIS